METILVINEKADRKFQNSCDEIIRKTFKVGANEQNGNRLYYWNKGLPENEHQFLERFLTQLDKEDFYLLTVIPNVIKTIGKLNDPTFDVDVFYTLTFKTKNFMK